MKGKSSHTRSGFTLAEILLSMLVFSIAISTILALLARSVETADEIVLKNEAIDLSSSLDAYLSDQLFIDVYDLVRETDRGFLYAYSYRGDLNAALQTDGSLAPFSLQPDSEMGEDYTITSAIRDPDVTPTSQLDAEDQAREGRLFHVRVTVSPANPYTIANGPGLPADPNAPSGTSVAYDSAVLVLYAEFFPIPVFGFTPASDADPVFAFNLAVRR